VNITKQDLLRILIPSKREVWIIVFLVLLVFVVFEGNLVYLRLTQETIFSDTKLQDSFSAQIDAIFADNKFANTASLVVFWAGVGLVAYSVIWSIHSFFAEARGEAEVGQKFINQSAKQDQLHRSLVQAGALAGIIALGLLSLNVTVPFFISMWTGGILTVGYELIFGSLQIIAGFIGMFVNFYLFKVLMDWIIILE